MAYILATSTVSNLEEPVIPLQPLTWDSNDSKMSFLVAGQNDYSACHLASIGP